MNPVIPVGRVSRQIPREAHVGPRLTPFLDLAHSVLEGGAGLCPEDLVPWRTSDLPAFGSYPLRVDCARNFQFRGRSLACPQADSRHVA